MYKTRNIPNVSNIISLFFLTLFLSLFIVYGEQWVGFLNYIFLIMFALGVFGLVVFRMNEKILITGLIFFLTFNADYPLIYHPQIAGGTRPTFVIWIVDFPLLILLFKYILKEVKFNKPIPVGKNFKILLFIFIAWQALTIFNAIDYQSVLFQLVKDLRYFMIFLFLTLFMNNEPKKLHFVIMVLFFALFFQNIWAVLQFIKQSTFNLSILGETPVEGVNLDILDNYTGMSFTMFGLKFGKYISGFTGSSYLLARENLLLFPLFFSMYLSGCYLVNRYIHFIGIFLIILSLFFGFSKGAWAAAFFSIMIIVFYEIKYNKLEKWKILFGIIISASIVAIFGKLLYLRIFKTNLSSSLDSRFLLNSFGIERFIEHPFMGVGANNIWIYFQEYLGVSTTVHNLYILILSEIGIIGLIVFIFIMFTIIYKTISIRKSDNYFYAVSAGLTASFAAFYFDGLWTWLYRFNPVGCLFWAICAVSFTAYNIANSDAKNTFQRTLYMIRA